MKTQLGLVVWFALAVALWVSSYVWPLVGHVLVPVGAVGVAFTALFIGEGVIRDVHGTIRMRLYERRMDREWAAFLAQRTPSEGEEATRE
ncbi:hypothetical protein ACQPYK_25265 [Streptosporangium sp. CA-135522]|uniref:hypothetical protein n=1 Tax=Streptosporangium sp. CA-135522 TaxID=3240072 RepID=UPI003D8A6F5D